MVISSVPISQITVWEKSVLVILSEDWLFTVYLAHFVCRLWENFLWHMFYICAANVGTTIQSEGAGANWVWTGYGCGTRGWCGHGWISQ